MSPIFSLAIVSVLAGIGLLFAFRHTVDQAAVKTAQNKIRAHLLELILYADEPPLIWRAHLDLLKANGRYLGLMLRPAIVSAVPMVILLANMDAFYGRSSLAPGQEALVTMKFKNSINEKSPAPRLNVSPELAVETDAVRVVEKGQMSWRIRGTRLGEGKIELNLPDGIVVKRVEVGRGNRRLTERLVSSIYDYVIDPADGFVPGSTVEWVEVRYPKVPVEAFGLELHWLIWFFAFSGASMLLLKSRFSVSF
jgi:hypothetical protein